MQPGEADSHITKPQPDYNGPRRIEKDGLIQRAADAFISTARNNPFRHTNASSFSRTRPSVKQNRH